MHSHSNHAAWTSFLEPVGISIPVAALLSAEVPFGTGYCLSERFTGYRKTFRFVATSFSGKPRNHCFSSCTGLCPWTAGAPVHHKTTPWKILALLGLYFQRSFYSLKLDTCLTSNTNVVPEKTPELATSVVPASCTSGVQVSSLASVFQDAPARFSSLHEAKWVDLYIKKGGTWGDHAVLWHAFSGVNGCSLYSP